MKAVVEPLEGNKVKLSIEVDENEFEQAINAAFRKIAREVRIPGFRPGKAPRRILEARLGKESGRAEALREALPDYYSQAVRDHQVDAIAAPEIDITAGEESGPVAFDAVVEVRPQLRLAGYGGLRVEVPSPVLAEEDVAAQIDRMRANFAQLSPVDRPAANGDHLTIDFEGTRDGSPVAGMSFADYDYELGSDTMLPELDEQLLGVKAGDNATFSTDLPDGTLDVKILVKDIKETVLPEITDEWASDASEFDTLEELRADITKRLGLMKRVQATMALRNGVVEALVQLVEGPPPEPLVDSEVERRAHDLGHRLEAQGANLAQYLQATGQSEAQVIEELRATAVPAVQADLALRAVAEGEQIDASDDELAKHLAEMAANHRLPVGELRAQLERNGQMPAVRSDLKKSKALEWLVEHAEVVDPEGHPVDRALLEPDPEELASDADQTGEQ